MPPPSGLDRAATFSTWPFVRLSFRSFEPSRVHDILKMHEMIFLQIDTSDARDKWMNDQLWGSEGQKSNSNHMEPKLDFETWQEHHSRLFQSSRLTSFYCVASWHKECMRNTAIKKYG